MRAQVVVLQDGQILLASHQCDDRRYWVLPGGAVEPGKTPEEAAVREVREETGLEVRLEQLLFVDGPREDPGISIRQPRYTYLGQVVRGALETITEPDGGSKRNGFLSGADWMPFEAPEFDAATRDTLALVRRALG